MIRKSLIFITLVVFSLSAFPIILTAAGSSSDRDSDSKSKQTVSFKRGKKAVDAKDYSGAIPYLLRAAKETPENADVYNLLGYSHRKLGKLDKSLEYYNKALAIEPEHLGANEYIGELFLKTDRLSDAEKHLAILDKACFFGCEEYDQLKEAIANYKANKKSTW